MCLVTYSKSNKYSSLKKIEKFNDMKVASPLWAYIEITSRCAHKCPWCYGGFPAPEFTDMDIKDFMFILRKLKDMGIYQISITGGEPTDHPRFKQMIELADDYGFMLHLVTNGDNITFDMLEFLKRHNVEQIQFNFQGTKWHDKLHVKGSFETLKRNILSAHEMGFEAATTTVIGEYNIDDLDDIMKEADECGADRIRVWDVVSTPKYMGNATIDELFSRSESIAKSLGYNHTVSYDPEVSGDIQVKCPSKENLIVAINPEGISRWCPVIQSSETGSFLTVPVETIQENLIKKSDACQNGCVACRS